MSRLDLGDGQWADLVDRLNYAQSRRIMAARGTSEAAGTLVAALVRGWQIRTVDGGQIECPPAGADGIPLAALDLLPWDLFEVIGTAATEVIAGAPDPKGTAGPSRGSAEQDSPPPSATTSPTPTSSSIIPAGTTAT